MREAKLHELCEKLSRSAGKTVVFFESQLKENGTYGEKVQDLACYYKSPMMFILAGREHLASRVLTNVQARYMTQEGDFKTNPLVKSVKPEYVDYWTYTNGWIVRAAHKLHMDEITRPANKYLSYFNVGKDAGFLTNELAANNGVTDVFTAAHHGLINLEQGNSESAISAGNYLCEAMHKQPNLGETFYLRFYSSGKPISDYKGDQTMFYRISKNEPDQLYFMIGYPCAYLALLYKETQEKKYLEAAKSYLDFALECHESVFRSNFSHKVAWASSLLYELTGEEKYLEAIKKITDYFVALQDNNGMWYLDTDLNSAYDQSAEIACWFMGIAKNLYESKKEHRNEDTQKALLQHQSWASVAAKTGVTICDNAPDDKKSGAHQQDVILDSVQESTEDSSKKFNL